MERKNPVCLVLIVVGCLSLAACGGSGAPEAPTSPTTLVRDFDRSGMLTPLDTVSKELSVGRHENGPDRNVIYSFDLSQIPEGAVVTEALLRFVQTRSVGDPALAFGDFIITHIDIGTTLDFGNDYGSAPLEGGQKLGETGGPKEGPFVHEVTSWVLDDLSISRPYASFRLFLEFVPGPPPGDHLAILDDPNDVSYAGPATLTVHWTMP